MTEFKEGMRVVAESSSLGRNVWRDKIRKLYKNGNFVLEGSDRQFRPDGLSIGGSSYYFTKVYPEDHPHAIKALNWSVRRDLANRCLALDFQAIPSEYFEELRDIVARIMEAAEPKETK